MFSEKMTNKTQEAVKNIMRTYDKGEFELFKAELGWVDWMNDYTTATDGEVCSESEIDEINSDLGTLWNEVHG